MIESNILQENQQKEKQALLEEIQHLKAELADTKEKLADKSKIFNTILEKTFSGYWDWSIQSNTEYYSPTYKKMFGYTDDEFPNHPDSWKQVVHPDDLPKVYEQFNLHVKSRGRIPFSNEIRYYHKNGHIVWVYCRGRVIEWDENDQPLRMVGSHVDITKLKNALEQLSEKERSLIRKNKELEQFAYIASHDLQEPLRTISSFVGLLLKEYQGKLDDQADLYMNFIVHASTRMGELIQGLLDYSRLGRDKFLTSVDCNELIENIRKDLESVISSSKATFSIGELPVIEGFKVELRLLFQNLISNAIKFQAPDSTPHISISAKPENGWTFAIQDNGIGIADRHMNKIFTIFQRLHTKEKFGGTGIGLAHAKKIVELHKGNIWIESEPGQGSTFYFNIPKADWLSE